MPMKSTLQQGNDHWNSNFGVHFIPLIISYLQTFKRYLNVENRNSLI